jgi:hypothetical protein
MKKSVCFLTFISLLAGANAQQAKYTVNKTVSSFNGVEVGSGTNVKLISSDSDYVKLSSSTSIQEVPEMNVNKGILEINSNGYRGKIEVYVHNITSIKVSDGAGLTSRDTLRVSQLSIQAFDASNINMVVCAKRIKAMAKNAGNIKLSGSTDSLDVLAEDAGDINTKDLKAAYVNAVSRDGSDITVTADSSIEANSYDGSDINIKGNPKHRINSAVDGGSVSFGDSCGGAKHYSLNGDLFIGGGFVTGGSNGAGVEYGNSREFIVGFGTHYNWVKWNALGWNLYYKSTDFYLAQNASKTFPEGIQYKAEKVSTQNFGVLLYDRFNFGKHLFFDAGAYGDWVFHSKHVIWNDNTTDGSTTWNKTVNLSYVNPFDYGVTARLGYDNLAFYFNYRLSNTFQTSDDAGQLYPLMPKYVVGLIVIL